MHAKFNTSFSCLFSYCTHSSGSSFAVTDPKNKLVPVIYEYIKISVVELHYSTYVWECLAAAWTIQKPCTAPIMIQIDVSSKVYSTRITDRKHRASNTSVALQTLILTNQRLTSEIFSNLISLKCAIINMGAEGQYPVIYKTNYEQDWRKILKDFSTKLQHKLPLAHWWKFKVYWWQWCWGHACLEPEWDNIKQPLRAGQPSRQQQSLKFKGNKRLAVILPASDYCVKGIWHQTFD